jgi:hypothetical protein
MRGGARRSAVGAEGQSGYTLRRLVLRWTIHPHGLLTGSSSLSARAHRAQQTSPRLESQPACLLAAGGMQDGCTALLLAAAKEWPGIVKLLLGRGSKEAVRARVDWASEVRGQLCSGVALVWCLGRS